MKKLTFLFIFLGCGLIHGAVVDGIAAKVNDLVITVGDVMAEVRRNPKARERMAGGSAAMKTVYLEALNTLIDRKLILKTAQEKKMEMQEWVIDNRVREIVKENFAGDRNKLTAALAETKTSVTDWRNNIREDMIVSAMRYQIVDKDIQASPVALRRAFETNRKRYTQEARTTVRVILLKPARKETKDPSVESRSREVLDRLGKGEDFADLARRYSSDSKASSGGLWKDIKPDEQFRPEIAATIAKLKIGEHSPLVNLDGWGFIVRKDAETKARSLSFAEAYDQVARDVRQTESQARYVAWTKRLRADAYIKVFPLPDEKK